MECEYEVCLSRESAEDLVDYLIEIDRWSRTTWAVCEPVTKDN